ncbi:unnamed protein product [Musa acuminata subsp. malaccensis]|uniref:(wild Malaysian banana) hypothetical protein n=1 Tax=Musa acuminata subsp. malaccensis TaxID=214687 RepID=A0A804J1S3_MUSAM|nr:unnamed protein product [Musa acuminata subsp. malaccensis]
MAASTSQIGQIDEDRKSITEFETTNDSEVRRQKTCLPPVVLLHESGNFVIHLCEAGSKLDDENADHGESDEEGPVAAPPALEEHRPWVELPHLSSRLSADDPLPLKVFGNSTPLDAIVTAFHLDISHIITNPRDSNLNIYTRSNELR